MRNRIRFGLLVVCISAAVIVSLNDSKEAKPQSETVPVVTVATYPTLFSEASDTFIGTVSAQDEVSLKAEVGGRITSVPVTLGQRVRAGDTIAVIENAAERAAVTQAEGAYEAARAAAAQSDIGVEAAETALTRAEIQAESSYERAYTRSYSVVVNTVDIFFADPNGFVPGLRIDGPAQELNEQRVALQDTFEYWQRTSERGISPELLDAELMNAVEYLTHIAQMLDTLAVAIQNERRDARIDNVPVRSYLDDVTGARQTIASTQQEVRESLSGLKSARESLTQARIGGTADTDISAANAQVKQALGALQSAEARLADTIIRTPIAGRVGTLSVRTGEYIQPYTDIARVVNENGFEITIAVGADDQDVFSVGDSVRINGTATGTVSAIAPSIDPRTGKTEVRVNTTSTLRSGDTVRVSVDERRSNSDLVPHVPLNAIRFTNTGAQLLTVEDDTVTALPIEIGEIQGNSVRVTAGLDSTTRFITDARGRVVGETVRVVAE